MTTIHKTSAGLTFVGRLAFVIVVFVAMLLASASANAEECAAAMTTKQTAVLYDSHSTKAGKLLVLSANYPLRRISFVFGWCKVLLPGGESGWVRAADSQALRAAVALANGAIVRADPDDSAPGLFYAKSGVVMEVLGRARPGWWQVLHADGETGYAAAGEVWVNF